MKPVNWTYGLILFLLIQMWGCSPTQKLKQAHQEKEWGRTSFGLSHMTAQFDHEPRAGHDFEYITATDDSTVVVQHYVHQDTLADPGYEYQFHRFDYIKGENDEPIEDFIWYFIRSFTHQEAVNDIERLDEYTETSGLNGAWSWMLIKNLRTGLEEEVINVLYLSDDNKAAYRAFVRYHTDNRVASDEAYRLISSIEIEPKQ